MEFKTISEIHEAYAKKKTSPVELTQKYLEQAKKNTTNSYLHLCQERALSTAKEQETLLMKQGLPQDQPLFGIPMGIKDVLTMDGVKTTCASRMLESYIPPYTSTAVMRLEKAGVISLGKLNMDEFAMGGSNENSAFGRVLHPTHPERVPGGSSGGSAACLVEGSAFASLGTDTGGSVRLPASFCGVVGLKPTYGRVSRYGLVAFASSLDQIGPLSHTVKDSARILEVIAGHDPYDSTSENRPVDRYSDLNDKMDFKGLKIGVPKEFFAEGIDPEVRASVEKSLSWFEKQGAKKVEISLPHTKYAVAVYYVVTSSEASSNLARFDGVRFGNRPSTLNSKTDLVNFYKEVRSQFGSEVKRRIILGTFTLSSGYYDAYYNQACQVRRLIRNDLDQAFKEVDVILSPTSPVTAFKAGEKSDPLSMYLVDVYTNAANLAGIPGISIPCGKDSQGLPIGLQLMTNHFEEKKLLQIAHSFECGAQK